MPVKHNGPAVVASLKRRGEGMKQATREITRFSGRVIRDAIRGQIPPGTPNDTWDDYAATGKLRSNVVYSEPEKTATGWKVKVYVPRYNLKYFAVHEYGKTIYPKSAKMLVFPKPPAGARYTHVPGRRTFIFKDKSSGRTMIATEYVVIRPKKYFAKGIDAGIPLVRATLPRELSVTFRTYGVTT